jgi:hypothetical protein
MSPEEYLKERVEEQIDWYSKRADRAKSGFQICRATELIGAAMIPFAAGFLACGKVVSALLGMIVAVSAGFASLFQFQQNWIEYRTTSETLKKERMHFLTHTAPYDDDDAFSELVQRIETLVSKENINWSQYTKQQPSKGKKNA